ncbi:hypothetical protein VTO58DRAFT_110049 [Aureobasidium pullulans]
MEKQILPERDSGYISKEELETLLRKTFGIRDNYNVEKVNLVVEMTWKYYAPRPLREDEIKTITEDKG